MNVTLILKGIALLSWLGLIGAIVYAVAQAARGMGAKKGVSIVIVMLVIALGLNIGSAGLVYVADNQMGVVITIASGGVRPEPLNPGIHWIIPYAESLVPYTFSSETYTMTIAPEQGRGVVSDLPVEARTADGQVVHIDASVIFRIDRAQVVQEIHVRWRGDYVEKWVKPEARGVIRDAVSQYGIEEVYSVHRQELIVKIEDSLREKLDEAGLLLDSFVLRNIQFSEEYSVVIESKQIAEQRVLEEKFVVDQKEQQALQAIAVANGEAQAVVKRAEGDAAALLLQAQAEADARLIKAKAEAEALALLGEAIAENPNVLLLEYIQRLAPNINVMLLPSDNPFLLPLPDFDPTLP